MKKFITLLLVLTGMVSTASADTVTRRFMVIKQVDWLSVTMYASYKNANNEEVAITDGWPGTSMTHWKYESSKDVWYIDLTIPDGVSTIKVAFNNGSSGGSNQTWDYNNLDISTEDKLFYIYDESGDNNNHGISPVALDYYISGWKEGESDHSDNYRQKLEFNSDGTYSCVLDFTSYTATGNRIIVPFFASGESDGHPWVDWNFTIRPVYSTAKIAFEDKNSTLQLDGGQCWTFKNQVKYKCTFDFVANTWSVEPYFTRNISAGYATFSSAYDVAVDGAVAWYAKEVQEVSAGNTRVVMKKFTNGIPANTGALLEGSGDVTFTPATSTPTAPGTNLLIATVGETTIAKSTDGAYHYILGNGGAGVGFYNVDVARNSGAGKAYLETATALSSEAVGARAAWIFDEEGETTGIAAVKASQKTNGEFFNLAGQRIAQPTKGLYIVNGKKVIIK